MHKMLAQILREKRKEIRGKDARFMTQSLRSIDNNLFLAAIKKSKEGAIIGEIKFASPSAGKLGTRNDLKKRVEMYEKAGIAAISLVTEKHFFHGTPDDVAKVKK